VAGEPVNKSKKKILVIEDDPDMSRILARLLSSLDAAIITAPDGLAGVALALSERPQLVLMDIQLPGMNGLDAIRTLRSYDELADVPVIVLTGHANPENIRQAVDVGADDFLVKANVVAGDGLERIRQALETRPGRRRPVLRSGGPFGRPSPAP
jgi:CheY-like chemotaxis protein